MLSRLSIRARLVGIAILFLVPIALQVYLFVDQSRKDITFSDKEVSGLVYLRGAWPVLHALAAAVNDPAQPAAKLQSAPKLEAAAKTYDGEMGSEQASRELVKTLAALGWPGQPVPAGDKADAAITAARALINKIGDASNLILDPDLDSYYVMDITLLRLPEAVDQARVLMTMAATMRAQKSLSDDEKAQVLIRAGQFAAAVDGIAASLELRLQGQYRRQDQAGARRAGRRVRQGRRRLSHGDQRRRGRAARRRPRQARSRQPQAAERCGARSRRTRSGAPRRTSWSGCSPRASTASRPSCGARSP